MAGTDGEIVLPPDSTGKKLDHDALDYGGGVTKYRQRGRVAGAAVAELADVKNADPAGGAYGIVSRLAGTVPLPTGAATQATLAQVLTQLQAIVAELGGTLVANVTGSVVAISGNVPITAAALPLPAGAATEATLLALKALVPAALGVGGGLKVDGSGTAIPVTAAALPLPAGAATQVTLAAVLTALGGTLAVDASGHNLTIGGTVAVSVAAVVHVDDNAGSLTVDSAQLPAALGAGGGVKVDGSGTALPISVAALPARSQTVDSIAAADVGDVILIAGVAYTVKRVDVNATASPADLVALVAAKKLRVISAVLNFNVDGTFTWRSNATAKGGAWTVRMGGGFVLPHNKHGWFETVAGEKLACAFTTVTQISGFLSYIEV